MARSLVARRLAAYGGRAVWRQAVVTDNGNHILDVHGLTIEDPPALERELSQLAGVVTVGLFAVRPADVLILGTAKAVEVIQVGRSSSRQDGLAAVRLQTLGIRSTLAAQMKSFSDSPLMAWVVKTIRQ